MLDFHKDLAFGVVVVLSTAATADLQLYNINLRGRRQQQQQQHLQHEEGGLHRRQGGGPAALTKLICR